jgi:hypothetical protein
MPATPRAGVTNGMKRVFDEIQRFVDIARQTIC